MAASEATRYCSPMSKSPTSPRQLLIALKLTALPRPQRLFWPALDATPPMFRLAGGTGLALQLGHRTSIDFDFFAFEAIEPRKLLTTIPYLADARPLQIDTNTLTVQVLRPDPVKISYFGLPRLKPVAPPLKVEGTRLQLSNLIEISAFKAAVVSQRAEVKDYLDIAALLTKTDISLIDMLAAASKLYGRQFNPLLTLQALGFLEDPALAALPATTRRVLRQAVAAIDPLRLLADMRKANIKPR